MVVPCRLCSTARGRGCQGVCQQSPYRALLTGPTALLCSGAPPPLRSLARLHHASCYQQGLAQMLETVVAPALQVRHGACCLGPGGVQRGGIDFDSGGGGLTGQVGVAPVLQAERGPTLVDV